MRDPAACYRVLSEVVPVDHHGLDDWPRAFARVGRLLAPSPLTPRQSAQLREVGIDWGLSSDEAARALMVLELERRVSAQDLRSTLERTFRSGDSRERTALLRALPLVATPEAVLPLAIDACRTSVVPIFEAIACDHDFPALYFPAPAFRQLVMKALFIGVALVRVRRLAERVDPELRRMGTDLVKERRAAGRAIPPDLALIGVTP